LGGEWGYKKTGVLEEALSAGGGIRSSREGSRQKGASLVRERFEKPGAT